MTFMTTAELKKWKWRFLVSLFFNIILFISLIIGFIVGSTDETDTSKQEKVIEAKNVSEKESVVEAEDNAATNNKIEEKSDDVAKTGNENKEKKEPVLKASGDLISVELEIKDNFFASFTDSPEIQKIAEEKNMPRLGQLLSAHISRNLVWDIDLRKDMRKKDLCAFIFRIVPEEEKLKREDSPDDIEILALSYHSQKLGKDIEIHFFKPEGQKFGKFYYPDGKMIEKIIKNGPIRTEDYIQVTSLLNDRRPKHEGIDFKAPVGTPIFSPFNGKVLKTNWKTKYNGYSIEIEISGKNDVMKFLHLDKVLVKPGDTVKAGQKIAESGNTGRSTAPHLHYQINKGGEKGKVVDPYVYHETYFETLKEPHLSALKKKAEENNKLMHKNN